MSQASEPERPPDLSALRIDRSPATGGPGRGTRRLLALLVVFAVLTAGIALAIRFRDSWIPVPEVQVASARIVSPARADSILTATGYLVSRTQAAIGAKVSGRVEEIRFEEGDRVDSGQVLAVLEHADLDASLGAALAALARARADVTEAEAVLLEDERDLVRKRNLYEERVGSQADWEQADARRDASRARLDALRQQVSLSESTVTERQELLANMFIRAPFAGTVISKDAEVGETITPGGMGAASGRGSVATLADLAHLEVETDVKEDYIGRLRLHQPARVQVDAVPDRTYEGRLRQIIPMGDRSRAVIQVKVEVLDADERLFPEMSASVHFLPDGTATTTAADGDRPRVYVPAGAIVDRDGKSVVWVLQDGTAHVRTVETLPPRDGEVEIVGGLEGGESVIVEPPEKLSDGDAVRAATS